jgi:AcrR family transcriptional regulator
LAGIVVDMAAEPAITTTGSGAARKRYAARMPAAERREQLLDATLELITDEGHDAATIEAVARRGGVARPVVYRLFGDRTGLLEALYAREEARAVAQMAEALPSIPDDRHPDQLLVDGVRLFLEAVRRSPRTWKLVLVNVDTAPPALREEIGRRRELVRAQLEGLVAWGLERRGGPGGLDVEMFARAIQTLAEDAARLLIAEPERFPPERFVGLTQTMVEALANGSTETNVPPPALDLSPRPQRR